MSGADKYEADVFTPSGRFRDTVVLARDYDRDAQEMIGRRAQVDTLTEWYSNALDTCRRLEAERDELRAQVEAMRALLTDARRYVDKAWPDGVHSYRTNSITGDLLGKIDAALQAKP